VCVCVCVCIRSLGKVELADGPVGKWEEWGSAASLLGYVETCEGGLRHTDPWPHYWILGRSLIQFISRAHLLSAQELFLEAAPIQSVSEKKRPFSNLRGEGNGEMWPVRSCHVPRGNSEMPVDHNRASCSSTRDPSL
jgi:hypothetical protein